MKHKLSLKPIVLAMALTSSCAGFAAPVFVNHLTVSGTATDLAPNPGGTGGANVNRLGGFGSDFYYDRNQDVYYGLNDRGAGGGVYRYDTRVQKFKLDVSPDTGAIGNFKLLDTILFKDGAESFNGLNPEKLNNGDKSVLGRSLDPEGFVVGRNGNFYVSDEYGPSVKEFRPDGSFIRSFTTPSNILPKASGELNFVDGRPTLTTGRQDNRGFEGLAVSPDGKKMFAMLQDPLVNEGDPDGRRSRNLRIVEFDVASGLSTKQFVYQTESLDDLNARVPDDPFGSNAQGRNIGISAIIALNDKEFLIIERDNRGAGVDDPTGEAPVASKRIYKISIDGATDVSALDLTGTNDLPAGVTPVSKTLYFDLAEALTAQDIPIAEKLEGITVGKQLDDGSYALILGTDNDFSVTQDGDAVQFDVCTDGVTSQQVDLDSACPAGLSLLPSYLFSIKADGLNYAQPQGVPEPGVVMLMVLGLVGFGTMRAQRRRNR